MKTQLDTTEHGAGANRDRFYKSFELKQGDEVAFSVRGKRTGSKVHGVVLYDHDPASVVVLTFSGGKATVGRCNVWKAKAPIIKAKQRKASQRTREMLMQRFNEAMQQIKSKASNITEV